MAYADLWEPDAETPFQTVDSIAHRWGVSRRHVYGLVAKGDLPAVRFGRAIRIHDDDAAAYIERHRVPA